jgi:hypothetical protein
MRETKRLEQNKDVGPDDISQAEISAALNGTSTTETIVTPRLVESAHNLVTLVEELLPALDKYVPLVTPALKNTINDVKQALESEEGLDLESIEIYGLDVEQIRKLREYYINNTGDTILKELGQ